MNRKLVLGFVISLFSIQTFAASFGIFDPRSLAMGGTGVASGDASNASHYNPALLALTNEDDDFSLVVPFAIGISDKDDLAGTIDTYSQADYETALDTAITNYNTIENGGNATQLSTASTAVATAAQNLLTGINTFSNKSIILSGNVGVLLAVPSKTLGVSVYTANRVTGGTNLNIDSADTKLVQDYIDVLSCVGEIDPTLATGSAQDQIDYATGLTTCYAKADVIDTNTGQFKNTDTAQELASALNVRGAVITEVGISFAHKFKDLNDIALGVTPKVVTIKTFDSSIAISSADSVDASKGIKSYSDGNIDFGAVMAITDSVKAGIVIKNIISKEYKTALNNTVSVKPQYRAGIAYQNDWVLVSADYDISKNEAVGLEDDSQDFALGLELDLFDLIQARAGYRQNTVTNNAVASAGLGFSPFGLHVDLGVAGSKSGIEAGLQLGVKF